MAPTLGNGTAAAAPNDQLLVAAGAAQGAAAELSGKSEQVDLQTNAFALNKATETGAAMYGGYVANEAETAAMEARKVIEGQSSGSQYGSTYASTIARIQEGTRQGKIDQAAAQSLLAAEMRRLIAAHPSQADSIRKEFRQATGSSDWETLYFHSALTAKQQQDTALKAHNDRVLKMMLEGGVALFGDVNTASEVASNPKHPRYAELSRFVGSQAKSATALQQREQAAKTRGLNSDEYANTTVQSFSVDAMGHYNNMMTRVGADLTAIGITATTDLHNLPEDKKSNALQLFDKHKAEFLVRLDNQYRAIEMDLRSKPAGSLDADKLSKLLTSLDVQRKEYSARMDALKDPTLALTSLKTMLESKDLDASVIQRRLDNISKIGSTMSSVLGPTLLSNLQDPNKRSLLLTQETNNKFLQDAARIVEAQQVGATNLVAQLMPQMERYNAIARQVKGVPELGDERHTKNVSPKEVADVTNAMWSEVSQVLKAGVPNKAGAQQVTDMSLKWFSRGQHLEDVRSAVVSGRLDKVYGKDEAALEKTKENLLHKSNQALRPDRSIAVDIRDSLGPTMTMWSYSVSVDEQGRVVAYAQQPNQAPQALSYSSMGITTGDKLGRAVSDLNSHIDIIAKLNPNINRRELATKYIESVKTSPKVSAPVFNQTPSSPIRPAPNTTGGAISDQATLGTPSPNRDEAGNPIRPVRNDATLDKWWLQGGGK